MHALTSRWTCKCLCVCCRACSAALRLDPSHPRPARPKPPPVHPIVPPRLASLPVLRAPAEQATPSSSHPRSCPP
eukprot:4488909-Prymnesium_polylepis.2